MHPFRTLSRIFVPAALLPSLALAVPTAVNDTYSTPEDTTAGSSAVDLINATFDPVFTLPNSWQIIDLSTSAAGGTNTYPVDDDFIGWKALAFDTETSNIIGWRAGTLPAQGGGVSAFPASVPSTLTGLVPGGPNTVNTYLFRNRFNMTVAQAAYPMWNVTMLADDGCIIYINGVEKGRLNYPEGVAVEPDAVVGGTGGDENNYTTAQWDLTGVFSAGQNVVAIELHQNDGASSDAGLDFQLSPVDPGLLSGFTGVDDAFFGTNRATFEAQTHSATGGFNGSGALRVQMGNYQGGGGGSSAVSGAWRRTFTLAAPGTVTLSFRHRMISAQDYDVGEYQEVICDVNGTQYGVATAPSTHLAIDYQVGDGNGGGAKDTGWKQRTLNIPLAAGNHTLSLGGYANAGTGFAGFANESFEIFFDDVSLNIPGTVSLLANDTGGVAPVTAVKATDPVHGDVTVNADGSFSYISDSNWFGADTFTYKAVDGTGESVPATVTVNVTSVNDIPVAVADGPFVTLQSVQLVVDVEDSVLANDSDLETAVLTAAMETTTPAAAGTTVLNPDGSFTFTPVQGFAGPTSFSYRASDGAAQSAPATVTINVTDSPDPPTAVADSYTAVKNTQLAVTATTASILTDTVLPFGSAGWHYFDSIVLANRDQGTEWRTNGYTENADWKIGAAELGYDSPADEVTVIADNEIPGFDAQAQDRFATYYFRRTVDITDLHTITGFEVSVIYDDALAFYLNGDHGGRTTNLPDLATMPELDWNYFPNVQVNDNSTQTFPLPASALLSGPNLIAAEVHQNGPGSGDVSFDLRLLAFRAVPASVLDNDLDPDAGQKATLTAEVVSLPSHGALAMNANGTFTYTPANGYTGPDSFTYRAKDTTNLTSAVTTANITVITGPNVAPVANPNTYAVAEDTLLNVNVAGGVLANDTDAEGDPLTAVIATLPEHGVLTLSADGSFNYRPDTNFEGADSFTYRAADPRLSAPATVTITVTPVNDEPVAVPESYVANPGQAITISAPGVLGNDTDVETPVAILTALLDTAVSGGSLTLNLDGSFNYTAPAAGGTYTFSYRSNDGSLSSAAVTVTIVVNGAPTAGADSWPLVEDNSLTVNAPGVLGNDSDPESQPLTAQLVSQPSSGSVTLNANGSFTYTPATNFAGPVSFSYKALDGQRESAPATVTITISNVNDAPVASSNSYAMLINTILTVSAPGVMGNDNDPDAGTILTAELVENPALGVLIFHPSGAFTYTPAPGFGPVSFTYRISDGLVFSNVATVNILVSEPVRDVKISEIMFRPGPPFPEPQAEEWIELQNTEPISADISGWALTSGVSFTFPPGTTIPANGRLVVVANVAAFQAKYPGVMNAVGPWVGNLGNNGESITLSDVTGVSVNSVEYASQGDWAERYIETQYNGWDWRSLADGEGRSLELRNLSVDSGNGQNWGPSSVANGTPGAVNSIAVTQSAPLIFKVRHSPAIPTSGDQITISCELKDEFAAEYLAAAVIWRDATTTPPGAWNTLAMTGDGHGDYFACIPPRADKSITEFYISATDGSLTRTWPAPAFLANGTPAQTSNCQVQVDNEVRTGTDTYYRLNLTAEENNAFNTVNSGSYRVFNQTLIVARGAEVDIHYSAGMRIRGNSSRNYQFRPLRITVPNDDPLSDGSVKFNLNPRSPHLQYLGQRTLQVMGLAAADSIPVELRRNGVESTTFTGNTPDYGKWVRMEAEDGTFVSNHFSSSDDGNIYKKIDNGLQTNYYWRSAGFTVPSNPDGTFDGWSKSNNSSTNDWSDLTHFCTVWQAAATPHFPGAPATDVSQSTGGRLSGSGAWNNTAFTAPEMASIATVADLDYWARWFAAMTIIQSVETNLSNGVDDDYTAYFLPGTDGLRRMIPVAHDLDTVFGQGDSPAAANARGLYDMCDNNETFRSLLPLFGNNTNPGDAAFRTLYHQRIREAYGGWLNASTAGNPNPPFYQFVDKHLVGWAPANVITNIKNFATQRQTYLLGLIGSAAITPPAATSTAAVNTAHGTVMISEILAGNVAAVNVAGAFPDVIELHNSGATEANLSGLSITDDPAQPFKRVFPAGTAIPAGGYLLLYADGLTSVGHVPFSLNSSGETVVLYDSVANGGGVLDSITFGLQIPDISIGRTGATLQTWTLITPSPGEVNAAVSAFGTPGGLFINEWLANTDFRVSSDFAEIYNPAANPVAIGGMSFSDDLYNAPARFVFPQLSFLPAGSFTRFDFLGAEATPGNATEVSFRLGATFGNLALLGQNSTVVDIVDLVSQPPDASTGRTIDGGTTIATFAPPASLPSPGASNAAPSANILNVVNNLRVTEIHFNPSNGADYEFIELTNTGTTALELLGVRFVEGIDFVFPAYSLAPAAHVFVAREPARYPAAPVVGPYIGALDNSGETIGLMLPAPRDIYIQRFAYKDTWEAAADGGGNSLQFWQTSAYPGDWDEGEFWQSLPPTPGAAMAFALNAGPDQTALLPGSASLDGTLSPGSAGNIILTWSKVSGPGTVTFTNTIHADTSATFSQAGLYTLRLTSNGTAGTSTDDVEIIVRDTYATWAARTLAGFSAPQMAATADADNDGIANLIEHVLGTDPAVPTPGPELILSDGHLALRYNVSKFADPGIQIIPQISGASGAWQDGIAVINDFVSSETATTSTRIAEDIGALGANATKFLRLKVVSQ